MADVEATQYNGNGCNKCNSNKDTEELNRCV